MLYRSWALIDGTLPKNTIIQVVAQSVANSYVFDTHQHAWDDVTDHTLDRDYIYPGFSGVLDKKDLKPGKYTLWLCLIAGNKTTYRQTEVTFTH